MRNDDKVTPLPPTSTHTLKAETVNSKHFAIFTGYYHFANCNPITNDIDIIQFYKCFNIRFKFFFYLAMILFAKKHIQYKFRHINQTKKMSVLLIINGSNAKKKTKKETFKNN